MSPIQVVNGNRIHYSTMESELWKNAGPSTFILITGDCRKVTKMTREALTTELS